MQRPENTCDLKSCFLCRNSLSGWTTAIASHKKNYTYKKGQSILEEGQPVTGIYFLYEGMVKVHKKWGEGKELILKFARAGDIIGYRGLGEEKLYPVSVTALEPCTVCFIDLVFFETTLEVNHQLTYQLMKFYSDELLDVEKRMRNLALMEVKGRLADTLLSMHTRFGQAKAGYIDILLSRQDLASFIGTTYETLFRTLNELSKEKIIKLEGKKIFLLKPAKLKELITVG